MQFCILVEWRSFSLKNGNILDYYAELLLFFWLFVLVLVLVLGVKIVKCVFFRIKHYDIFLSEGRGVYIHQWIN